MGAAMLLVWRTGTDRPGVRRATGVWLAQLALNLGWSLLFFGRRAIGPALVEIVGLWLAVAATALAFHRERPLAGWLLAPYLAWATFAAGLNAAILQLNR